MFSGIDWGRVRSQLSNMGNTERVANAIPVQDPSDQLFGYRRDPVRRMDGTGPHNYNAIDARTNRDNNNTMTNLFGN